MKKSIFFSFGLLLSSMAFGQTTTENYIKNITYRKAFTDATKSTATNVDKIEAVAYYDGLGRPKQNIAIRAGGQSQDVITTFAYDAFGRQAKEYLPYALASNNGVFRTDALTATGTFYNTTKYENTTNPFSEKAFEASPLNRVLKQAAPGYDWRMGGGKEIKVDYLVNAVSDNVEWFGVSLVLANNTYTPTLTTKGNYALGELIKVITKDENYISGVDRSTEVFTDKYGRIILERKHNNGTHDTYYVYDDYGNLTYVLSPKMDASNATLAVIIGKMNDLGHQYIYDHKNRIVESKIPGKGWGYIVYNKRNQPILSQDELLKSQSRWLFMLYDIYGRVAFTGLDTGNSSTRITLQTAADAAAKTFVTRTTAGNTYAGTVVYYSNDAYPTSYDEIHGVNYYDSYIDSDGLSVPTTVYSQAKATNTKGLATVSKLRVLDSSPVMWETSISGYDNYGRMMYAANKNNYFTITDIAESKLDFLGNIEETKNTHTKNTTSLITIDKNTYDHMGRITKQTQTLGTHVEVIAQNTYDELGQLKQTKVGNTEITPLQTVDYDYNVRGWLKNINDVSNIGTDLFAFKIGYNTPSGGTPLYNGNISQITWKTLNVDQNTKFYNYSYDALNRITAAIDNTSKFDLSSVAYDKNGNITSLLRKGSVVANPLLSNAANYGVMDNLTFTYDAGNKLTILSDIGSDTEGARDDQIGTSPDSTPDYAYDVNGNMTSDLNKGILANGITYNHFNLPKQVTLSGGTIKYVYNALGIKLRKIVTPGVTTDYAGNYLYENGVLKFFNHPQGYVEVESGLYKYVYQYKDHLDNVRLSYSDTNGNGSIVLSEIREENNYYPFGLKHKGYNNGINGRDHKFEYNNTELEKVFGYDIMEMTFRQYDPAIARFTTIDPVVHHSQSTYASFDNNPIFWADPSGADSDSGGFGLGRSGRLADNVQIFNFGMGPWRDSSGDSDSQNSLAQMAIASYTVMANGKAILIAFPDQNPKIPENQKAAGWIEENFGDGDGKMNAAGHAGIVIIDGDTGATRYFDFGRYKRSDLGNLPTDEGAVRSSKNFSGLSVPDWDSNKSSEQNVSVIVTALHNSPVFKGYGTIMGTLAEGLNYKAMFKYAIELEKVGYHAFGGYGSSTNSSNPTYCAKFARGVAEAGGFDWSWYVFTGKQNVEDVNRINDKGVKTIKN